MYCGVMFWICFVGIFTSGLMILACCCKPCAKIAAVLNFFTQLASLVMLILGSYWRFNSAGRACAVTGKTSEDVMTSFITGTSKVMAKMSVCATKSAVERVSEG